jgi:hypothetical protein
VDLEVPRSSRGGGTISSVANTFWLSAEKIGRLKRAARFRRHESFLVFPILKAASNRRLPRTYGRLNAALPAGILTKAGQKKRERPVPALRRRETFSDEPIAPEPQSTFHAETQLSAAPRDVISAWKLGKLVAMVSASSTAIGCSDAIPITRKLIAMR